MEPTNTYTKREQAALDRALDIIKSKWCVAEEHESFVSPLAARDYLNLFFADKHDREYFVVVFLTSKHDLIATEVLFAGTIDGAAVYPREVVKAALRHNCAAVILAHNHPSGAEEASQSDRHITARIDEAMKLIDVRLLDHVIVAPSGRTMSFAEQGLL